MKSQKQLQVIGESLLNSKKFATELQVLVRRIQSEAVQTEHNTTRSQYEFAFEKATKKSYPWASCEGNQPIECMALIQEISSFITDTIENNLHAILNKEFINVTNQILAMRQQISVFTKQQMRKSQDMQAQLNKQLESMRKKISLQGVNNQPNSVLSNNKFFRSSGIGLPGNINNSVNLSGGSEMPQKKSIHHQLYEIRKQVQNLKKKEDNNQQNKHFSQRISHLQEKFSQMNLETKIKIQEIKQKSKKNYQSLSSQVKASSPTQLIKVQIKKSLKSALKIYLDEIMKCKKQVEEVYELVQKNDKGIQQYVCNQLKSVWTVFTGMKRRVEQIQENMDLGNQSMMIE